MSKKPATAPALTVAQAKQALADAKQHRDDLETAIVDGDTIDLDALTAADAAIRHAELSIARAERVAAQQAEQAREQANAALLDEIARFHAERPGIADQYRAVVAAVAEFLPTIRDYTQRGERLANRAQKHPDRPRVWSLADHDWTAQLIRDAANGYKRTPRTSFMSDSHALAPELFRLLGTRATLENTLVSRYRRDWEAFAADEPQKAARLEQVRARLAELGEGDDQ